MKDKNLWKKKLSKIENYSEATKESESIGAGIPEGRYNANVQDAKISESGAGNLMIAVNLKVVDDEEQGDVNCTAYISLAPKVLARSLALIKNLGFEISDDPSDLADVVEELAGSGIKVSIKSDGDFVNILNLVEDGNEEDGEDSGKEEEEVETEESSVEIAEGSKVTWKKGTEDKEGTVIEVLESENLARIEIEGGKVLRVPMDKLTVVNEGVEEQEETEEEEEEEEIEEEPVKNKKTDKTKGKKKGKR